MAVRVPLEVELFRRLVGPGVGVGRGDHDHDLVALFQLDAVEPEILAHIARLGELHWRHEAQELLDREVGAGPVLLEPVAQ